MRLTRIVTMRGLETEAIRVVRPQFVQKIHKTLADAKDECPVDTGDLQRSGASEISPDGDRGEISFTTHYVHYVHNGTSRQAANPFLARAIYRNQEG